VTFQSVGRFGLGRALAISLVCHLLLLWPAPAAWQESGSLEPMQATLRAPPVSATPAAGKPAPRRSPPQRPAETVSTADQPVLSVPVPTQDDSHDESLPISTSAGARRSGPPTREVSVTARASGEGLDAEGLRGYRIELARVARAYRRYPRQAEDAGWQGTAEVRVTVLEGGIAQEPKLLHSSGHTVLDEAALAMLRQALPQTPVPQVLRQRAFALDLPVVFELPE